MSPLVVLEFALVHIVIFIYLLLGLFPRAWNMPCICELARRRGRRKRRPISFLATYDSRRQPMKALPLAHRIIPQHGYQRQLLDRQATSVGCDDNVKVLVQFL